MLQAFTQWGDDVHRFEWQSFARNRRHQAASPYLLSSGQLPPTPSPSSPSASTVSRPFPERSVQRPGIERSKSLPTFYESPPFRRPPADAAAAAAAAAAATAADPTMLPSDGWAGPALPTGFRQSDGAELRALGYNVDSPGAHAATVELRTPTPRRRSYSVAASLTSLSHHRGHHRGSASVDASVDASVVPVAFGASACEASSLPSLPKKEASSLPSLPSLPSLASLPFPRSPATLVESAESAASAESAESVLAAASAEAAPSTAPSTAPSKAAAAAPSEVAAQYSAQHGARPSAAATEAAALLSLLLASGAVAAADEPEGAVMSTKLAGAPAAARHGAPSGSQVHQSHREATVAAESRSQASGSQASSSQDGTPHIHIHSRHDGVQVGAHDGAHAGDPSLPGSDLDRSRPLASTLTNPDDETAARGPHAFCAEGARHGAFASVGALSVPDTTLSVPDTALSTPDTALSVPVERSTTVAAEAAEATALLTTAPASLTTAPSSLTTAPSSLGSTSMLPPLYPPPLCPPPLCPSPCSSLPPPPRPKLLCRICECTVEIALMAEHSKLCMTDVVVFHVEHSLKRLRRHISSEIKRRDQALSSALRSAETTTAAHPPPDTAPIGVPDTAPILAALEGVCAHAHLTTSPTTCSRMLAYARELLSASQRLADGTTASYARQLIRMLSHVAPFLADAQDDAHAHEDAHAHDDAPPPPPAATVAPVTAPAPPAEPPVVERRVEHIGAVTGASPDLELRACNLPTSIRLIAAPMMAEPRGASPPRHVMTEPLSALPLSLTRSAHDSAGEIGEIGTAAPRESAHDSAGDSSPCARCVERELDSSPRSPLLLPISSDLPISSGTRSSGTRRPQAGTTARRGSNPAAAWQLSMRRTTPTATAPATALPMDPMPQADSLAKAPAEPLPAALPPSPLPPSPLPPFPLPETEVAVLIPSSVSSTEVGQFTASGGVHSILIPSSVSSTASARRQRSRPKSHNISSFEILKPISRGAYGHVVLAAMKTTRDLYAIYADACTSVTCMHTRSPRRPDACTSLTCMHTLTTAPRVPTGTPSKCCVRRTCAERTRCTESRRSVTSSRPPSIRMSSSSTTPSRRASIYIW